MFWDVVYTNPAEKTDEINGTLLTPPKLSHSLKLVPKICKLVPDRRLGEAS